MFKMLRRSTSTLTASALVLGLLAFVPTTLAAPQVEFNPVPATEYVKGSGNYEVSVALTGYEQDLKVDFLLGKKGEQLNLVGTHTFTQNETHKFTWNGNNATPGDYGLKIQGTGVDLSYDFKVLAAPTLTFNPEPSANYNLQSGDFKAIVNLKDYIDDTKVDFSIGKKGVAFKLPVESYTYEANGNHEFTWDGKLAGQTVEPGQYELEFVGKDLKNNETKTLTWDLNVNNGVIVLNGGKLEYVNEPADEYVVDSGDYKFSVKLTDFTTDTLTTVYLEGADAIMVPKDNYTFTDNNQTREFSLDLSDFQVGTYHFEIVGKNEANLSTNTLEFDVDVVANDGLCAGYEDVNASNKYCDALKWAKDEGIMTGQGDGKNFAGNQDLNRAEVSKISLMAYNEYNANTDYCDNTKPFPDVALGEWYSNYICRAADIKMVTGYEAGVDAGKFVPGRSVSVIEMFAILLRPLDENFVNGPSYQGLLNDQWYSKYAKFAKDHTLYPGTVLSPTQEATRYEVAQFLYELHLDGKL